MNGPIAQIAALVCHANAFLCGKRVSFSLQHSTFKFCEYVTFVTLAGKEEIAFAPTPEAWFSRLKEGRCRRILLRCANRDAKGISDRMSAGMVGGGRRWLIEACYDDHVDVWEARWAVGNREAPESRVWRVTYGLFHTQARQFPFFPPVLSNVRQGLLSALTDAREFATRQKLEGFVRHFDQAQGCLFSQKPLLSVYHGDLVPEGFLSLEATQILAGAQPAWVFGGMGSWNDQSFDGEEQAKYLTISDTLFDKMNGAIAEAVNVGALR